MKKYEAEYGFCKQLHYRGLWYVEYKGCPGHFTKQRMACSCIKDECNQSCDVFAEIPDVKDPNDEWRMKDKV